MLGFVTVTHFTWLTRNVMEKKKHKHQIESHFKMILIWSICFSFSTNNNKVVHKAHEKQLKTKFKITIKQALKLLGNGLNWLGHPIPTVVVHVEYHCHQSLMLIRKWIQLLICYMWKMTAWTSLSMLIPNCFSLFFFFLHIFHLNYLIIV